MEYDVKLTEDQERRIEATLKRIREGLQNKQSNPFEEPAHIFSSEAFNENEK